MDTFTTRIKGIPTWFDMPCIACDILNLATKAAAVVTSSSGHGLATCARHLETTERVMATLTGYDLPGMRSAFLTAGLRTEQATVTGDELGALFQEATRAAATAGPTDGDKLRAALSAFRIPSFLTEERGGATNVLVAVDRTSDEAAARTGPRIVLHSDEDAGRPAHQHYQPWAALIHVPGDGAYWELFTAWTGLPLAEECATTALSLCCWLTANAHRFPR